MGVCGGGFCKPEHKTDQNTKTWKKGEKFIEVWTGNYRYSIAKPNGNNKYRNF